MKIGEPGRLVRLLLWKQAVWGSEFVFAAKANSCGREKAPSPGAGTAQSRSPPEKAGYPKFQGDPRIAIEKAGAEKARAGGANGYNWRRTGKI